MNQSERRRFLIEALLAEQPRYRGMAVPAKAEDQKLLLRGLLNVRLPAPASGDFIKIQDEYLAEALRERGVTRLSDLTPVREDIYLWQGNITTLACGAIVNAANAGMTGCYQPNHTCIDNCIHTFAGVQLRNECARLMAAQGHAEPTGQAKLTPAYNLPCRYVLHTVGPIVTGPLTDAHREMLSSCYRACLALADETGIESVAFCCISTGVFGYPQAEAARTAVDTVTAYKAETGSRIKVIFNVFKDRDREIYGKILGIK